MRRHDIVFPSWNTADYPKPVATTVVEPGRVGAETGVLLVSHGWGGNRRDYLPTMEYAASELGLVAVSVEFRGSGHDFDPVAGRGYDVPYDGSFYQLLDVLGGLRAVLDLHPALGRGRIFHYGGHLALLSAVHVPATFALVYATSPLARLVPPARRGPGGPSRPGSSRLVTPSSTLAGSAARWRSSTARRMTSCPGEGRGRDGRRRGRPRARASHQPAGPAQALGSGAGRAPAERRAARRLPQGERGEGALRGQGGPRRLVAPPGVAAPRHGGGGPGILSPREPLQ